ncbi:hypothetical protein PIB30_095345 [Stylosanthes scabra]|uniref:Uncharacterized protein n=1 Tax=Stylosanthes scabra TaxID=79078 RepID=A0ABU6WTY8_9FABA|nr:hypothetical protein [Stylosanthes scabra]
MNSSARECYSVWAYQQANPNLVEMPVHKVSKQIYDNTNNNRPMFYGLLKSDLQPSGTAPPAPKSKDPREIKKGSLRSKERSLEAFLPRGPTHRHGSWRLCVLQPDPTMPRQAPEQV